MLAHGNFRTTLRKNLSGIFASRWPVLSRTNWPEASWQRMQAIPSLM
jgi:hypothetical protein